MTVNKLHNELHYLYFSPNIIRVTKSRRGNVAHMGRWELRVRFWWEIPEGKGPLGNLGVSGRIIFKCILNT